MPTQKEIDDRKLVARVVLRVPDVHHHTKLVYAREVVFTKRAGWSKQGPGEKALPGGMLDEVDFPNEPGFEGDEFAEDAVIAAAMNAVIRELAEEFHLELDPETLLLVYAGIHVNEKGYETILFGLTLPEKPDLWLSSQSGGTEWFNENELIEGEVELFADHLVLTLAALDALDYA